MQKLLKVSLSVLLLAACTHSIDYKPDISRDIDPLTVIKKTIERQSPAYQLVQDVEATNEYLRVVQVETTIGAFLHPTQYSITRTIYWENVKTVNILKRKYLWMDIIDKTGESVLLVYPQDENQAKRFADAVAIMVEKTKETAK